MIRSESDRLAVGQQILRFPRYHFHQIFCWKITRKQTRFGQLADCSLAGDCADRNCFALILFLPFVGIERVRMVCIGNVDQNKPLFMKISSWPRRSPRYDFLRANSKNWYEDDESPPELNDCFMFIDALRDKSKYLRNYQVPCTNDCTSTSSLIVSRIKLKYEFSFDDVESITCE